MGRGSYSTNVGGYGHVDDTLRVPTGIVDNKLHVAHNAVLRPHAHSPLSSGEDKTAKNRRWVPAVVGLGLARLGSA